MTEMSEGILDGRDQTKEIAEVARYVTAISRKSRKCAATVFSCVHKRIDLAFRVGWPCKWDVTHRHGPDFDWESLQNWLRLGDMDTLDRTDDATANDDDDEVASKSVSLLFGSRFLPLIGRAFRASN